MNHYQALYEPKDNDLKLTFSRVSHQDFAKMISFSWYKDATAAHIDAV